LQVLYEQLLPILHLALSKGLRVLIHCNAGLNRSGALVIAYLMRYRSICLRDAFALLWLARGGDKDVVRNTYFQAWLEELEGKLFTTSKRSLMFRADRPEYTEGPGWATADKLLPPRQTKGKLEWPAASIGPCDVVEPPEETSDRVESRVVMKDESGNTVVFKFQRNGLTITRPDQLLPSWYITPCAGVQPEDSALDNRLAEQVGENGDDDLAAGCASGEQKEEEQWACNQCTLLNAATLTRCATCDASKTYKREVEGAHSRCPAWCQKREEGYAVHPYQFNHAVEYKGQHQNVKGMQVVGTSIPEGAKFAVMGGVWKCPRCFKFEYGGKPARLVFARCMVVRMRGEGCDVHLVYFCAGMLVKCPAVEVRSGIWTAS